ncbi:hypothetical protein P3T76_012652 [Phytophthora citrophthora]|uniref:Uncharacterized protein n=1 Tax=Phytophthora citrophthora TaxID=4793 RepID=A0AAD9G4U9_9STRA|nr:hypothetical protein P3T76_012652 [Phytophthora citrophthora]
MAKDDCAMHMYRWRSDSGSGSGSEPDQRDLPHRQEELSFDGQDAKVEAVLGDCADSNLMIVRMHSQLTQPYV